MGITASNSTRRTRFTTNVETEEFRPRQEGFARRLQVLPEQEEQRPRSPETAQCATQHSKTFIEPINMLSERTNTANHAGNSLRHLRIPDLGCGGDLLPNGGGVPGFLDEQRNYGEYSKHRKESLQGL